VVEINAYMPGLKLKKALAMISEDVLHQKTSFRSLRAHAAFIAQVLQELRKKSGKSERVKAALSRGFQRIE
jgi:hypothetical protein